MDGNFCLTKKTLFFAVKFFGIRVFSLILYFSKEGVYYSVFGKKGKKIVRKKSDEKKSVSVPFSLYALHFLTVDVKVYTSGSVEESTYACGFVLSLLDSAFQYLEKAKLMDRGSITVLPCYTADQTMVHFSIKIYTSIVRFLSSFTHTEKEVNYAKRRNRKDYGENAG